MNELIQYAQLLMDFLQSNGPGINVESQQALGQMLQSILQVIQQQGQQGNVEGLKPQVPQLQPGPYPSSNVNSFKYDPNNEQLFVKFHGKDSANSGPTYVYQNIPRNIYDVFSKGRVAPRTSGQNRYHRWIRGVTPSLGASLYALIREGGFPYQKIA